jgi:hypothetical protein
MSIDAEVLNSEPVDLLCGLYATEYTSESLARMRDPVPAMLNALGACAGFAAQVAVWRTLVLPKGRNPGDYLVYVGKPNDMCSANSPMFTRSEALRKVAAAKLKNDRRSSPVEKRN